MATQKKLKNKDFTTTILVDQPAAKVFQAVTNPRGWWSENIEGPTEKLNDEFFYQYQQDHNCTIQLTEVVPDQKVVWLVKDNYFSFIKDQREWKGTKVIFEISKEGNQTKLHFTHAGLVPSYECYEICRDAWSEYVEESLFNLITTGKGKPNPKEEKRKKVAK